jgi:hypothetical protein
VYNKKIILCWVLIHRVIYGMSLSEILFFFEKIKIEIFFGNCSKRENNKLTEGLYYYSELEPLIPHRSRGYEKPKTKNLKPKTEKTENRKPKTENRKPKTENRKPKTENRKLKTENRKLQTENRKTKSEKRQKFT